MNGAVLGLTGGIASGKSTVARLMQDRGALAIDADQVARSLVAPGRPALEGIRERFGPSVMRPDGTLDRAALATLVFSDAGARADLNAIMHPSIFGEIRRWLSSTDPARFRVVEGSLLVESRARETALPELEALIVVCCDPGEQIRRLERKGMAPAEARRRLAAQADADERLAAADFVIENNAGLDELEAEVDLLWRKLVAHFA